MPSLVLPLPREEGLPAGHVGEARLDGLGATVQCRRGYYFVEYKLGQTI